MSFYFVLSFLVSSIIYYLISNNDFIVTKVFSLSYCFTIFFILRLVYIGQICSIFFSFFVIYMFCPFFHFLIYSKLSFPECFPTVIQIFIPFKFSLAFFFSSYLNLFFFIMLSKCITFLTGVTSGEMLKTRRATCLKRSASKFILYFNLPFYVLSYSFLSVFVSFQFNLSFPILFLESEVIYRCPLS